MESPQNSNHIYVKLVAQSKDRSIGIVQSSADQKLFSVHKVAPGGTSFPLYSKSRHHPIGDCMALHTTRGICITSEGFALFDSGPEIRILKAAQAQYDAIFSDPDALNSLVTRLTLSMPTDTTVIISSCHGAYVYDIVANELLSFLPPCAPPPQKNLSAIAPAFWSDNNIGRMHKIAYDSAIYVTASQSLIGFRNPLSAHSRDVVITTRKDSITSEKITNIESVEYTVAHESEPLYAWGNGTRLILENPTARCITKARTISRKGKMLISAIDFVPKIKNLLVAFNSVPTLDLSEGPLSLFALISSQMVLLCLIEPPSSFSGITRIDAMPDGKTATLWTEKENGKIAFIDEDFAQDAQQSSQHS